MHWYNKEIEKYILYNIFILKEFSEVLTNEDSIKSFEEFMWNW